MLQLSKEEMLEAADFTKAMYILFNAGVVDTFAKAMTLIKQFEDSETALAFANMSHSMATMGIKSVEVQQEFMKELVKPSVQPLSGDLVSKAVNAIYDIAAQKGINRAESRSNMKNPINTKVCEEPIRVVTGRIAAEDMWKKINASVHRTLQNKYSGSFTVDSVYVTVMRATTLEAEFILSFDITYLED